MRTSSLTVATWNTNSAVFGAKPRDWDFDSAALEVCRQIDGLSIDVLALQEVPSTTERGLLAEAIAARSGLRYVHQWQLSRSHKLSFAELGLAVISRFPISKVSRILLPNPLITVRISENDVWTSHDKGLLACRIEFNGRSFVLISLHLVPFDTFKQDAADPRFSSIWQTLGSEITRFEEWPTLVCGDFNVEQPPEVLAAEFSRLGLENIVHGPTRRTGFSHDKIYIDPRWTSDGLIHVRPTASDHSLCVAHLTLQDKTARREVCYDQEY